MEITEIQVDGYERVAKAQDPESGLHALIAVHDRLEIAAGVADLADGGLADNLIGLCQQK